MKAEGRRKKQRKNFSAFHVEGAFRLRDPISKCLRLLDNERMEGVFGDYGMMEGVSLVLVNICSVWGEKTKHT